MPPDNTTAENGLFSPSSSFEAGRASLRNLGLALGSARLTSPGHLYTSLLGHSCRAILPLHKMLNYSFSQMARE